MKVYKKQIGGSHYKDMKIQPAQFINENNLPFAEGNAIKYICRHQHKGEVQDLEKAKHYIDMIIERDYSKCKFLYLNLKPNGLNQKNFQT